jgi:hypothetical protein
MIPTTLQYPVFCVVLRICVFGSGRPIRPAHVPRGTTPGSAASAFGTDNDIQLAAMVDAKNKRFMSLSPVMTSTNISILALHAAGVTTERMPKEHLDRPG